ncbi:retrovirus-related Pol polyprotein from transposon 412 [Trichonephila clavipes]|nr:retrovirus-related Pol polyprotein from transposon 412 [Trichonephila clavipes]
MFCPSGQAETKLPVFSSQAGAGIKYSRGVLAGRTPSPDDKEKTVFTTGQGLWSFKVMPFGLWNAPATLERLMETVLGGLLYDACLVYLDDIIIVGRWKYPRNSL